MASTTIEQRLTVTNGRPAGFDYLRIILAVEIFIVHAFATSYGGQFLRPLLDSPLRPIISLQVPMFFALSGFLVAGSLERSKTMITFLGMRGLRIFPALTAEVLLSAFIIGPILTTIPLSQYYADQQFHHYLLNLVGYIHYPLPGLFLHNPNGAQVNSQLWTVPYELECYLAISLLAVLGIARRRPLLLGATIVLQLLWAAHEALPNLHPTGDMPITVGGRVLVFCFLAGVTIYAYRDRIVWSPVLAAASLVAAWLLMLSHLGDLFIALPAAYLTVHLGMLNPRRLKFIESGDYSYGIYLFGIPIQQSLASLGTWSHHAWISIAIAGPLTALAAYISWHRLEKHILGNKGALKEIEASYLAHRGRVRHFLAWEGRGTAPRPPAS